MFPAICVGAARELRNKRKAATGARSSQLRSSASRREVQGPEHFTHRRYTPTDLPFKRLTSTETL